MQTEVKKRIYVETSSWNCSPTMFQVLAQNEFVTNRGKVDVEKVLHHIYDIDLNPKPKMNHVIGIWLIKRIPRLFEILEHLSQADYPITYGQIQENFDRLIQYRLDQLVGIIVLRKPIVECML